MATFDCSKISLKRYSKGEKVKTLQTALKELGYYNRKVDGDFGYYTQLAVRSFQSAYKLTVDGWFASQSCKKLNEVMEARNKQKTTENKTDVTLSLDCPNIYLKNGSKGEQVKTLQTMLHALGYYNREIDGDFGTYTDTAVRNLQNNTGHSVDGIFGPKTCPSLNTLYAQKTNTLSSAGITGDPTPEYQKVESYTLTVLPDVVVLPSTEKSATGTVSSTGGSIETTTNFDCSKISLKRNSKGEDVKKLQTVLKARGYYTRAIDGDFGKHTEIAVKLLQKAQGNSQDGWFGQKTCSKLQSTSSTSNATTGAKPKNLVITDIKKTPSITSDLEGLTYDVSLVTPYTTEKYAYLRKLQKTEFVYKKGTDEIQKHTGYINNIKVSNEDDADLIELQLTGYTVFLNQTIEISEDKTAKRSELIKWVADQLGLKVEINLDGLTDDEYTLKAQKTESATSSGTGGLTQLSGNDCTDTYSISARSFNIDECKANTKIGNSSANYAKDTAGMSGKEALLDVYNRFHYGPSLSSSAVYYNNRRCPQAMWTKTGKFWGNCADISRLVKAVGEVHGMKIGIRHMPDHYYNLIEVDGKTYRFDCCCKVSGAFNGETTNNLNKHGGPWS